MKKISIVLAAVFCCALGAADYAALTKEAKAAQKEKNFALAGEKYAAAYNAAQEGKQKYTAARAYAAFLTSQKQKDKAAEIYENELKKENYTAGERQRLLVDIAAMYLWDRNKYQYALDKLNLALSLKGVAEDSILYYVMCHYAACIYSTFKKEYEPIITICEPAAAKSKVNWHKATLYNAVAGAYAKLKMNDEAIKNYELAIRYAKMDKGFNRVNGPKALERVEKALEKLKAAKATAK